MKTVLIITVSFPPINSVSVYRYLSMARYLLDYGWNPVVVTPEWTLSKRTSLEKGLKLLSNDPASVSSQWDDNFNLDEEFRVEYVPFNSREELGEHKGKKVCSKLRSRYFEYLAGDLFDRMLQHTQTICRNENIDVILSGGDPEILFRIANLLAREFNIPWVADYRDLIDQNPIQSNNYWLFVKRWLSRTRLICRNNLLVKPASMRTTVSEGLAERLRARNNIPVSVIMNGFDPKDFEKDHSEAQQPNRKFTITYSGTIYPNQHPGIFMEGLALFFKETPVACEKVQVLFYGQSSVYLRDRIPSSVPAGAVSLVGALPKSEMIQKICSSDVLLLLSIRSKGIATGKLFEYLAAKRPILSVPGDEDITDSILSETGSGVVAGTAEDVSIILSQWFTGWQNSNQQLALNSREDEIQKYSRQAQAGQMGKLLDGLTV